MAEIALAAGMSVGQIYRYFSNKETIIHAIVTRIVAKRLQWIARDDSQPDMPTIIAERMLAGSPDENRDDSILMLEVMAEATRNPAVAQIVAEADQRQRAQAIAGMKARQPEMSDAEATARVSLFAALFEGSALFRNLGLTRDDTPLRELFRKVIATAMS
jgi:AcrR family transcriptional regulator